MLYLSKEPFEITANDPFYSESNMRRLEKAVDDLKNGKGVEHEIIEVKDDKKR